MVQFNDREQKELDLSILTSEQKQKLLEAVQEMMALLKTVGDGDPQLVSKSI